MNILPTQLKATAHECVRAYCGYPITCHGPASIPQSPICQGGVSSCLKGRHATQARPIKYLIQDVVKEGAWLLIATGAEGCGLKTFFRCVESVPENVTDTRNERQAQQNQQALTSLLANSEWVFCHLANF